MKGGGSYDLCQSSVYTSAFGELVLNRHICINKKICIGFHCIFLKLNRWLSFKGHEGTTLGRCKFINLGL